MAVRKLYGTLGSPATMRALASLHEHQLEFEFIPIDLKSGEHKREPFLSLNPFGQVPAYQDEDLTVFGKSSLLIKSTIYFHWKHIWYMAAIYVLRILRYFIQQNAT
ncbi:hypothetical protein QQ045_027455 [Rhodiola kirilowii]